MRGGTAEASRILTLLFLELLRPSCAAVAFEKIRVDFQLSDTELGLLAREATLG